MTVKELKEKLGDMPDDLPVFVHNGMDPSDYDEARWMSLVEAKNLYPYDNPRLVTISS